MLDIGVNISKAVGSCEENIQDAKTAVVVAE